MRILFIIPYVPSPIRVRSFNLIKHLSVRHEVVVVTLVQSELERKQATDLRRYCVAVHDVPMPRWQSAWNSIRALPSAVPMQAAYCLSKDMERTIRELLDREGAGFDLAHIEHLRAAHYGWEISDLPTVFDSVDCISLLQERTLRQNRRLAPRLVSLLELGKTRRYEQRALRSYCKVVTTSPIDREALLALHPNASVEVLTIGVDLEYFRPPGIPWEAKRLVFSGKMSYHANVEAVLHFCGRILPIIWAHDPEVQLDIVGSNPPAEVAAMARDPRITVTGYVDDLRPFLARAAVSVCPVVYGAGVQIKVLEAMGVGTPVVASAQACSTLATKNSINIMSANDPEEFARSVLQVLGDGSLRTRLSSGGRTYVEEHHDWKNVGYKLETLYEEVIERWRTPKNGHNVAGVSSLPMQIKSENRLSKLH